MPGRQFGMRCDHAFITEVFPYLAKHDTPRLHHPLRFSPEISAGGRFPLTLSVCLYEARSRDEIKEGSACVGCRKKSFPYNFQACRFRGGVGVVSCSEAGAAQTRQ